MMCAPLAECSTTAALAPKGIIKDPSSFAEPTADVSGEVGEDMIAMKFL